MEHRLKVVHIITRLELGGAQQNTLYCCSHHDPDKYEVTLIAGAGGYLDEEAKKNADRYRTHFLRSLKHPLRPWWDLLALLKIAYLLRKKKADIVHTHSSKAGILGRWAAKLAGVPTIIHTVHGWGFYPGQFFLLRWFYQFFEGWTAAFTDALITVSEDNKKEGMASGIGRVEQYRVIHSGIQPDRFVLPSAQARKVRRRWGTASRPRVLILSNFKAQKSPLDAVKAADDLARRMPQCLFLWAGDGPLRAQMEREIELRGLKNNFRLLGWREDIADLLAACDVLLLTSLHEGLPRVVLQAMAAGKPVVATAVNGTPEAVEDGVTGYLHEPHDALGMAESLFRILSDKPLAKRMGLAGRRKLQGTFLIGEMLSEIEKLYDELVQRNK